MKKESFLKKFLTLYLPLIVILLFILFPFYWTFITSIKPDTELYGAVTYWPRHVQWENYTKLFTTTVNFLAAMKNSFIVAAVTTVVSLTASTLASYAFSRYRFAGRRRMAFFKIILPILGPCLVATGVYIFMTSWNEYTFAVMFTNNATRTIPVALKSLIGQLGVDWGLLTAGGIITIIPVCIMFFFAQKRLVEGLTAGAVKG